MITPRSSCIESCVEAVRLSSGGGIGNHVSSDQMFGWQWEEGDYRREEGKPLNPGGARRQSPIGMPARRRVLIRIDHRSLKARGNAPRETTSHLESAARNGTRWWHANSLGG